MQTSPKPWIRPIGGGESSPSISPAHTPRAFIPESLIHRRPLDGKAGPLCEYRVEFEDDKLSALQSTRLCKRINVNFRRDGLSETKLKSFLGKHEELINRMVLQRGFTPGPSPVDDTLPEDYKQCSEMVFKTENLALFHRASMENMKWLFEEERQQLVQDHGAKMKALKKSHEQAVKDEKSAHAMNIAKLRLQHQKRE